MSMTPGHVRSDRFEHGRLAVAAVMLAVLAWLCAALPAGAQAPAQAEPPILARSVEEGRLPPMRERLPSEPLVTDLAAMDREPGVYGGALRILEAQARDTRRMVVFGYARLAGYRPDGSIRPDIARAIDVEEGRRFTIHLRAGHRWSDGEPFTAEDFRYYWEDVVNDPKLGKNGLPRELLVDGKGPSVTFLDPLTIRYEWDRPNPLFLPAMAGSLPLEIFRPAHYLKRFHAKYADPAELERLVGEAGQRNWVALHFKLDQSYKNTNPELPSLQPWVLATEPPADRYVFRRNPFFHRVDAAGRQLPYIDEVAMTIAGAGLIPAKVAGGEADLQANFLNFGNYAFIKRAAERQDYDVRRWRSGRGSRVALYPNLTVADPAWRAILRDVRFRRALSLAINREDINQVVYYGLARPSNDTILAGTRLFEPDLATRWAGHDPAAADALLDAMGLTERNGAGIRLRPDGEPVTIVLETAGEEAEQSDVLQLVTEDLARVGIGLIVKPVERDTLERRLAAGSTVMAVAPGLENGAPVPSDAPDELAPTASAQFQWPDWGLHFESAGRLGSAPDLPFAAELVRLATAWRATIDPRAQADIWRRMLEINADEVVRIGLVADVDQVVVVSNRLRNVPKAALYNFNPGAFFGMHRPDTFFFAPADQVAARGAEARP